MAQLPSKLRFAFTPSGGYKAGALYPIVPNDNVGNFDVVRNSIGTRVNKDGLIEVMDANVPRLDYSDGGCPKLLTESSGTNLVAFSNDFMTWSGGGASLTPNYAISPDGTQNATRINFNTNQTVQQSTSVPIGVVATASIYIKGNIGETILLNVGGVDGVHILIGEWQRIETSGGTSNANIRISTGGGVTARDILVWGAQMEQGSFATSYIPTNGSSETRQADQVSNAGNSSTFNSESGVLFADVKVSANNSMIELVNSTNQSIVVRFLFLTDSQVQILAFDGTTSAFLSVDYDFSVQTRIAIDYSSNNTSFWINGLKLSVSASQNINIVGLDTLSLLSISNNAYDFKGKTKSIQHYDYLSDLEMEQLTGYNSYSAMTSQFNFNVL